MSISVSPGTILMTHVCLGVCMFMCTCEHLWVCMCMRFFVNYMLLSQTLCVGWLNRSWIQRGRVLFLSHAANNLEVFFTFEREQGRERKKKVSNHFILLSRFPWTLLTNMVAEGGAIILSIPRVIWDPLTASSLRMEKILSPWADTSPGFRDSDLSGLHPPRFIF